jgi:hypothetical protein
VARVVGTAKNNIRRTLKAKLEAARLKDRLGRIACRQAVSGIYLTSQRFAAVIPTMSSRHRSL